MQGLAGLDIGRQLIHRSLFAIGEELPHIESFLTLSPIPGFLPWLQRHLESGGDAAWHSEEEPYRQMILERLFLSEADQEAGVPPLCRAASAQRAPCRAAVATQHIVRPLPGPARRTHHRVV